MRHFFAVLVLTGMWAGPSVSSCRAAGPEWECPAHSFYNSSQGWTYRIRVYFHANGEDHHFDDFDYSGPTAVSGGWWRWDRNFHQIDLGTVNADAMWGLVENSYMGGAWYPAGVRQYSEPP